jgi:pimeloyl-ACP methyl ester carboxylesterase
MRKLLVAAAFAVSAHTTTAGGQAMRTPESQGYATVNGVELYYEVHGDGPPLIMLHGGVTPSEMFGAPLAEMAKSFKVVALHFQGHGLSKDSSRPWSFEVFAADVAAVMGYLGIKKASVMGYSSGALVAGVRRETRVRFVLVEGNHWANSSARLELATLPCEAAERRRRVAPGASPG